MQVCCSLRDDFSILKFCCTVKKGESRNVRVQSSPPKNFFSATEYEQKQLQQKNRAKFLVPSHLLTQSGKYWYCDGERPFHKILNYI